MATLIFVHNFFFVNSEFQMLIVKDSMVLIHLAVVGVLREACMMFGQVKIPNAVHEEVVERGIAANHADAFIVQKLEKKDYIKVVAAIDTMLMSEMKKYGLQGDELEAVTLYIQEKADLIVQ